MPEADQTLGTYLHLVQASRLRRQPMVRDKLLVLAGVQALEMGLEPIAALCRHRVLAHNPRHLVRRWPTLAAALDDGEFQLYLKQLRRRYSREKLEHMLTSLRIELGRERQAYDSDLEYAAALLGTRPEAIQGLLAELPEQPGESLPGTGNALVGTALPWTDESIVGRMFFWGAVLFGLIVGGMLLAGKMLAR